jgi:3-phosphoshikimate 1-carboxyvinyltransferase
MKVKVYPGFASGQISVPPSKSLLHRAIISACLAKGKSVVKNIVLSEDIKATIEAFKRLGIKIQKEENSLIIYGKGDLSFVGDETINCNESGSTIRFIIPIFTNSKGIKITGKPSLLKRPLSIYEELFKKNSLTFERKTSSIFLKGELPHGVFEVAGNVSSQFISGLMFALPLKTNDSIIKIIGNLESKRYVDMTIFVLSKFGIKITQYEDSYYIKGNQKYNNTNYIVESDFSQLAFFAVAGTINGEIKINNVNLDSLQPDKEIINIIRKMEGKINKDKGSLIFSKTQTIGIDIDVSQSPDIAPILSILGGLSLGQTNILNAKRLRIKETDRLKATNDILNKLGVRSQIYQDSLIILGQKHFNSNTFNSYNDHRMVMSLAIAALRANKPIIINRAEAINKSYPHFFEDLQSLGIKVEYL